MKRLFFLLLMICPLLVPAQSTTAVAGSESPVLMKCTDTITGDFDGDGKREYVFLQKSDRVDSITLSCSNGKIPAFRFHAMGSCLSNEGDLDDNGTDEMTVCSWSEGAWQWMTVYTFRKGSWIKTIDSFSVYGPDGRTDYVKKGPAKGQATIWVEGFGYDGQDTRGAQVVQLK